MKVTKLQQSELDVIKHNDGLALYLTGLLSGRSATPQSSLYNIPGYIEKKADSILDAWLGQLRSLKTGTNFEQEVYQFDLAQLAKWGPQGEVAPIAQLLESHVFPTFAIHEKPAAFSTAEWSVAKDTVAKRLRAAGCRGLRPADYKSVVDDMRVRDTLESNAGWPLFTTRSKSQVVKESIKAAQDGRWKTYPAIALFRNYNGKTRLVWMFPMSANLVEGSFFQPLQSAIMRSNLADSFYSPWKGFEAVRHLVTEAYSKHEIVAASDFSATDEHFQLDATMEVYDVLATCFQPQYRASLKESLIHMHTIPLVIGPDSKIVGRHGVSSGSNWTNFIESVFDEIFAEYVALKEHDKSGYAGFYAIGDDMSWRGKRYDASFQQRLEEYGKEVGHEVKAEKTTNYSGKVKSLQRLFQAGYLRPDGQVRAVYSTIRALHSAVQPEKRHRKRKNGVEIWNKDMNSVRLIMILENCVDHPLFIDFVKFFAKGDPYLVTFAKKKPSSIDEAHRKAKLIPGFNPTYNQERRDTKLSQFATVRVLQAL